eukprot:jgi/Ulvmu1/1790/UM119_0008.1
MSPNLATSSIHPFAISCISGQRSARARCSAVCRAGTERTDLERIIKRKSNDIEAQVQGLGLEWMEEKLQDAMSQPLAGDKQFQFGRILSDAMMQKEVLIIAEVPRMSQEEPSEALGERARKLQRAGVHALSVRTDVDDTPCGLRDLFSVVQAAQALPIFRRDWFIHPLQVIEAKEAGASGVLGVTCQVSGKGTPVMSAFAGSMGMDAPVEAVNLIELDFLMKSGVPMVAVACGVHVTLTVPGFADDVIRGLLPQLPLDVASVVGVADEAAARHAAEAGASAVLLKQEALQAVCDDATACKAFVHSVKYAMSGDD